MGLFIFGKKNNKKHECETVSEKQQQILNEEKRDMIQGIEEMSETTVKEVMVPRIDVDFFPVDIPEEDMIIEKTKRFYNFLVKYIYKLILGSSAIGQSEGL